MKRCRRSPLLAVLALTIVASGCGKNTEDSKAGAGQPPTPASIEQKVEQATAATKAASVIGLADRFEPLIRTTRTGAPHAVAAILPAGQYSLRTDGGCKVAYEFENVMRSSYGLSTNVEILDSTEALCKMRGVSGRRCKTAQKLAKQIELRAKRILTKCPSRGGEIRSTAQLIRDAVLLRRAVRVTQPGQP